MIYIGKYYCLILVSASWDEMLEFNKIKQYNKILKLGNFWNLKKVNSIVYIIYSI